MRWEDFVGHQQQRQWFTSAVTRGRLGSTFLFVGPAAIGKRTFAMLLAKTLLCDQISDEQMQPCNQCESCVQLDAQTHPDLLLLEKPADKSFIPVEKFVGPRESRMQEGLCHDIRLRPYYGRRKIAIIDDADHLNQEGANCLLKTLEEPPPGAVIILIGTSLQRQLPTIRSRCQVIRFSALPAAEATSLLSAGEIEASPSAIEDALQLSGGDLRQAAALLDEESLQFKESLVSALKHAVPSAIDLAGLVGNHVNSAGQDASDRRERMRQVFRIAVEYYRVSLRDNCDDGGDDETIDNCLYRIDRCVDAISQVDRNANQQTLIETWAWDIQRGTVLSL